MSWVAVGTTAVGVGGSIVGGMMSSNGQKQAAAESAKASEYAANLQWQEWLQEQRNLEPYLAAGKGALTQLSNGLAVGGQFNSGGPTLAQLQMDPGYAWRTQQGVNALSAAGAAAGNLGSGNLGTALVNYSQGAASQEYQNAYSRWQNQQDTLFNRLSGVAGTGQTATAQLNAAGQNAAGNIGNIVIGQGQTNAASQINAGNAWSGAIGNVTNNLTSGLGNYYNQQQQNNLLTAAQAGMNYSPGGGYTYTNPAAVGPFQS